MIATERFVLWSAAMVFAAQTASAQLTWAQHGALPSRPGFTSAALGDKPAALDETRNRILLPIYVAPSIAVPGSRAMWEFDGQNWSMPTAQDLPVEGAAVADDPRPGRKVMFSGSGTRIWDPVTRHWDVVTTAHTPAVDSGAVMALLPGIGTVQLNPNGQTWVWDGVDWTLIVTAHSPPPRSRAAMSRDVVGNRLLMMGLASFTQGTVDAWWFDGTDWTQTVTPPYAPAFVPLDGLGMATDEIRQRVVLFGGRSLFGYMNSTALWNGTSWSTVAPAHVPTAGAVKGMCWNPTIQKVILCIDSGGFSGAISTWAWDGTDWTELLLNGRGTVVEPPARSSPVLAYSGVTNKTVMFGGYNFLSTRNDTWESAGRLWQQRTPPSNPPATNIQAAAILRSTGDLYHFPGRTALTTYSEQWNWGGQQWSGLALSAPPITPMQWQVVGSLQSSLYGWVFVRLVTSGTASWANTLQIIQPFSGSTSAVSVPGGPVPRFGSVMVQSHSAAVASNKVWLFGGQTGAGADQNDLWQLADTGSGGNLAWTQLVPTSGPVPPARIGAAAAHDGGNLIYIMGGLAGSVQLGDTWTFNLVSRQWNQITGPGPSARNGAAMTFDAGIGHIVLVGGYDGVNVLGDIWECNGSTWSQRVTPPVPPARNNATLVYDRSNHRSLLFGGTTGEQVNDTWSYDGSVWRPLVGRGPQPAGRQSHSACFDESWNAMVVFGGLGDGATIVGDTWRLSASETWTPGPSGPPARCNAAMTYAVLQGIPCSILVGGYTASGPIGDTWRYDIGTNNWQQIGTGPTARDIHAVAWDRLRNVVVLFGGRDSANSFLDDTWELNLANGTWSQRTPAHRPPGRWNHAMSYDTARARTVVVGGYAGGYLDDVWEWNGTDWQQRTAETVPAGAREDGSMTYDSDRGRLLLFGGHNGSVRFADLWELGARIDRAGAGNTAQPAALRFYSQPALGQQLRLGFANPQGLGIYTLGFGPLQQPLGPAPAPPMCEPTSVWATLVSYLVLGTTEPNIAWNVPNSPLILGVTLVFQAFAMQPANCWRATDALHVRF